MQFITHPFVYNEDLKWSIQGYSFCLFAVATVAVRGVYVRENLFRNNLSSNFSSIRSRPMTSIDSGISTPMKIK